MDDRQKRWDEVLANPDSETQQLLSIIFTASHSPFELATGVVDLLHKNTTESRIENAGRLLYAALLRVETLMKEIEGMREFRRRVLTELRELRDTLRESGR